MNPLKTMANEQIHERNRGDNLVINHRVDDEADLEGDIGPGPIPRRPNMRNHIDGDNWQAAAVANVAGESLQIRSRKWDKIVDMLLRLPFLFLLDQILLQDMGWNGLINLHKGNFSAQVTVLALSENTIRNPGQVSTFGLSNI